MARWETIDSYNGEAITTDYISTTGGLDIGAKIMYQLPEPAEPVILTPEPLETHYPSTIIEADSVNAKPTLDISVKIEE